MDQIRERDYAGRYALDPRRLVLIGANFVERGKERRLELRRDGVRRRMVTG